MVMEDVEVGMVFDVEEDLDMVEAVVVGDVVEVINKEIEGSEVKLKLKSDRNVINFMYGELERELNDVITYKHWRRV